MRKIKVVRSKNALNSARKYYLAYGLNTNIASMQSRCTEAKLLGNVWVTGYRLCFKNHCDVVPDTHSKLNCVLWSITQECETHLDILEGYPEYYTKKNLTINYQDKNIQAMIYHMQGKSREILPSQNYLDLVVQGYKENNLNIKQIELALLGTHNQEIIV
jgi:gamma-glutamylcyclotransferase